MTTRELFESRFPVPERVFYELVVNEYRSRSINRDEECEADLYNAKWIGFQAGYEASITIGRKCAWTCDEYEDAWDTGCGNLFSFIDGSPEENKFEYCCYCGGNLTENKGK